MKYRILAVALAAATLGAAPAASAHEARDQRADRYDHRYDQRYDRGGHGQNHPYAYRSARQLDQLRYQIRRGRHGGYITPREARRLNHEFRYVERLRIRYIRSGGMSRREARDLGWRINDLSAHVRRAIRNDRRHYRWR